MTESTPRSVWQGVYGSFTEAAGDAGVFESDVWLESVRRRCADHCAALTEVAAIPSIAATRDYVLPILAALVYGMRSRVAVLDFGGGLASACLTTMASLPADADVQFTIVETEAVCRVGSEDLAELPQVRFASSAPTQEAGFDVVHAGSSLHYVENWRGMIAQLAAYNAPYMLFSDIPAGDIPTFVTTQLYHRRYIPVHFWNLNEFCGSLEGHGYRLIYRSLFKARIGGKERELPTEALPPTHRLRHTCHLMFQKQTLVSEEGPFG